MEENKVNKFEKEYSTCALLKRCVSVINHILVDKNICTAKELSEGYVGSSFRMIAKKGDLEV